MPPLLQLRNLSGKGDGGWNKKCLCVVSVLLTKTWITSSLTWKKMHLGHPIAQVGGGGYFEAIRHGICSHYEALAEFLFQGMGGGGGGGG